MVQNQGMRRKEYLDLLRILAILWVLFNHTGTRGFKLFTVTQDSALFGFYLFSAVLCKTAVPIFLMISGALLLKKEEPFSVVLKKRFLKYLALLVVVSFIMHLYYLNWDYCSFSLGRFLKQIYSSNVATAYWYLYTYLAFILTLPLLRKMSRGLAEKDYLYLTCLMAVPSVLRCFELFFLNYEVHYNSDFDLFTTVNIVYYPLMGDFLANKLSDEKVNAKNTFLVSALGILFVIISCWLTYVWCERFGEWNDQNEVFINRFIFIPAIAIFIAARFLFMKVNFSSSVRRGITYLGSCTFGIFLFEKLLREGTVFVFKMLSVHASSFVASTAWIFCAFFVGVLFVSIAKKIPFLKNVL